MTVLNLGTVEPGSTIYIPFDTFAGSTGASITMSGLAVGDIKIYKNGGTTERASTTGFTLLDTDGIDFDALTGLHGISIDLSSNADSGFYTAGADYMVGISTITVDSQTVSFWAARFKIGYPNATINTTIATLSTQTSFTLTAGPAEDDALNGCTAIIHDIASAVQLGHAVIQDYTGSTKTVTLVAGVTFTAAAGDNISIFRPALQPTVWGRTFDVAATGEGGLDWANVGSPTATVNLSNTTIATTQKVDVETIKTNPVVNGGTITFPTGSTLASTTNITAGVITTVTNLTNAPTSGDLTATMKASVNAEVDTAIADARLDELLAADSDIDGAAPPAVGSVFHELMSKTAGSFTFDQTTDSNEAIRDNMGTAQTGDSFARLGAPAGASIAADIAAIEAQTDDIGAAGAGLTAVPWNPAWDAEVESEANDALIAQNLDHLVKSAVDTDFATTVQLNSVIGHLADNGTSATFDRTTDSLEANRDNIGTNGAALSLAKTTNITGFNDLSAAQVNAEADAALADVGVTTTVTGRIDAAISSRSSHSAADVWAAATRTLTAFAFSVTVGTNNDKTGYSLSSAGIQAIWDALTSALTTAGSIGKLLVDNINATISSRATPAQVNAEVVDALATDTYAEPGQGAPAATTTLAAKINYLYKAWRNKKTSDGSTTKVYADDGTTVDQKQTTSESGGTVTKAEWETGP